MKRPLYLLLLIIGTGWLYVACDLIEYHPYDTRISKAHRGINAEMAAKIEALSAGRDTLCFAQITDTQRWFDETEAMVDAINRRGDIQFVIHTGDQTDFGLTREYEWQRRVLKNLKVPYVCIIGNHDCLGTGEDVFHTMYGDDNISINAGFLHLVCLNTNAFEYDYSRNVPDFDFIKHDIASTPDSISRTVVAMHAMPGSEQFNNNVTDYFSYMLGQYPGLSFCICGHDHHGGIFYPTNDSIPYYECSAAKQKNFLVFTLTREGYTYESIEL